MPVCCAFAIVGNKNNHPKKQPCVNFFISVLHPSSYKIKNNANTLMGDFLLCWVSGMKEDKAAPLKKGQVLPGGLIPLLLPPQKEILWQVPQISAVA
jgi:hypothetical protein